MKKYKLKQWYPSLALTWSTEDRYEYDASRQVMVNISNVKKEVVIPQRIVVKEYELHPDFWEVVKEPLFVTEDGVECIEGDRYILINTGFGKNYMVASRCNIHPNITRFFHESNADEYIWRKKRVFSYEEIAKRASQTELYYLETLAKERIEGNE